MKTIDTISLVIYHPIDRSKVLQCLRPTGISVCPGQWGLVGGLVGEGETPEMAALLTGINKLGVHVKLVKCLGTDSVQKDDHILSMHQYEAEIIQGTPYVPQRNGTGTQYQAIRWETKEGLRPALEGGSLCSKIFFNATD